MSARERMSQFDCSFRASIPGAQIRPRLSTKKSKPESSTSGFILFPLTVLLEGDRFRNFEQFLDLSLAQFACSPQQRRHQRTAQCQPVLLRDTARFDKESLSWFEIKNLRKLQYRLVRRQTAFLVQDST